MTHILFLIEIIYSNIFRCNYLRNKKLFLNFFFHFRNLHSILKLLKTWLDKCLKNPVSDDPLKCNMVNGPKHCWNLNGSTFTRFIGQCEDNSIVKSHSCWYAKYSDCLLAHWLPMTSIFFLAETIYSNIFRCSYLRTKILLWIFPWISET